MLRKGDHSPLQAATRDLQVVRLPTWLRAVLLGFAVSLVVTFTAVAQLYRADQRAARDRDQAIVAALGRFQAELDRRSAARDAKERAAKVAAEMSLRTRLCPVLPRIGDDPEVKALAHELGCP